MAESRSGYSSAAPVDQTGESETEDFQIVKSKAKMKEEKQMKMKAAINNEHLTL